MLTFITELPTDFPIGGVHCVPVLDNGNMMMVWDKDEQVLTTIGGRIEADESLEEALDREVMEEAGIELTGRRIPFASWFWASTEGYTVYYLSEVKRFSEMPAGFEKTGYVIMNFETAIAMITAIEGRSERIEIIRRAGVLSGMLAQDENGER
ncbi:NUDIX hydrolase [Paenibacillus rhizovicinus]|uniref:NUDIX hydrolase n=1 Tax=Paenibacillus rhizovicinus TaxID=2704463 RepID=A0A6C0P824_9BACL|nr:NUDIX hydrolase [Paenibacillus rhizovicinus]QHW34737.1 NUDIX hydrolase [Paenibacillus rhizovicinus]